MMTTAPSQDHYDVAVLGGGLAGLSVLYHLERAGKLAGRSVVLVDPAGRKSGHDRTWSFWEREAGPFEHLVHHSWGRIKVHNDERDLDRDLGAYTYKLIRSTEFYDYVNGVLDGVTGLERVRAAAEAVVARPDGGVTFRAGGRAVTAGVAFSSLPLHLQPGQIKQPYLDQHFRGWFVRTEKPVFDPAVATLMDFRTLQHGETRFLYVLPVSPTRALVEVAIFSNDHLTSAGYDAILADYLAAHWTADYEVEHAEQGNIPMTTYPFAARDRDLIYVGMRGGATRPSTGYTFWAVQRRLTALAAGFPDRLDANPWPRRHLHYDGALLRILDHDRLRGADLFVDLFARNPASRVLAFLNGETGLGQEIRMMQTTDIPVFGRAFVEDLVGV